MATIYDARSVNPDNVTPEQLAEVFAEHGVTQLDEIADFFKPGATYRRGPETFRCAAVGVDTGQPAALGYMPINLGGERTWELMWLMGNDWPRWAEVVTAAEHAALNRLLALHTERSTSTLYPTRHLERLVKQLRAMTDDQVAALGADLATVRDVIDRRIPDLITREQNTRLYEITIKHQAERIARLRKQEVSA